MSNTIKKYIKLEWSESIPYLDMEDVHFCEEDNTYFVPEELVNDKSEN